MCLPQCPRFRRRLRRPRRVVCSRIVPPPARAFDGPTTSIPLLLEATAKTGVFPHRPPPCTGARCANHLYSVVGEKYTNSDDHFYAAVARCNSEDWRVPASFPPCTGARCANHLYSVVGEKYTNGDELLLCRCCSVQQRRLVCSCIIPPSPIGTVGSAVTAKTGPSYQGPYRGAPGISSTVPKIMPPSPISTVGSVVTAKTGRLHVAGVFAWGASSRRGRLHVAGAFTSGVTALRGRLHFAAARVV